MGLSVGRARIFSENGHPFVRIRGHFPCQGNNPPLRSYCVSCVGNGQARSLRVVIPRRQPKNLGFVHFSFEILHFVQNDKLKLHFRRGIFRKRNADFADAAVDVNFIYAVAAHCAVGQILALQGRRAHAFVKFYAVIV